jgi:hypothetical protein
MDSASGCILKEGNPLKKPNKAAWTVAVVVVCLAAVGISVALSIVRAEGVDGLWKRKRGVVEAAHPGSGAIMDKVERRVEEHVSGSK